MTEQSSSFRIFYIMLLFPISFDYIIGYVLTRIRPSVDQHKAVTDFNGILGRCVIELMWCLTKQNAECSRIYKYPELTLESLQHSINVRQNGCCLIPILLMIVLLGI